LFLSIYENGSDDLTQPLLLLLRRSFSQHKIPHRIVARGPNVRTDWSRALRILELAKMRNAALEPLLDQGLEDDRPVWDAVLFLNDVFFCAEDVLELVYQLLVVQAASHVCGLDFWRFIRSRERGPGGGGDFYDSWVARDLSGDVLAVPKIWYRDRFLGDPLGRARFERGLPVQVWSCWNGISALIPHPFLLGLRFRAAKPNGTECPASECSLLDKDLWALGMGRVAIVPNVRTAYRHDVFDDVQRGRRPFDDAYYSNDSLHSEERIAWRRGPDKVICFGLPSVPGAREAMWKKPVWEEVDPAISVSVVDGTVDVEEILKPGGLKDWRKRVAELNDRTERERAD
ncbi:cryptococcal mannosyltransferase 1-domain-containing protein, partial [Hyaloraphidium curvatum]